jgi:hypothetical protein
MPYFMRLVALFSPPLARICPRYGTWDLWRTKWHCGGFSASTSASLQILIPLTARRLFSFCLKLYSLDIDSIFKNQSKEISQLEQDG